MAPEATGNAASQALPYAQDICWPSKAEDRGAFVLSIQSCCKEKT